VDITMIEESNKKQKDFKFIDWAIETEIAESKA
jgi:hypothetical protein